MSTVFKPIHHCTQLN